MDFINERHDSLKTRTRIIYDKIFGSVPEDLNEVVELKNLNDAFILIQSEKKDYLN